MTKPNPETRAQQWTQIAASWLAMHQRLHNTRPAPDRQRGQETHNKTPGLSPATAGQRNRL